MLDWVRFENYITSSFITFLFLPFLSKTWDKPFKLLFFFFLFFLETIEPALSNLFLFFLFFPKHEINSLKKRKERKWKDTHSCFISFHFLPFLSKFEFNSLRLLFFFFLFFLEIIKPAQNFSFPSKLYTQLFYFFSFQNICLTL